MCQRASEIISDFNFLTSWEEKYEYLIGLGQDLPKLDKKHKIDLYLIPGCQSKVWLYCEYKNKKLYFYADSDALITKGIVALILCFYSGSRAKDLAKEDFHLITKTGLKKHLSMTRANGLNVMLEKIKMYGLKHV